MDEKTWKAINEAERLIHGARALLRQAEFPEREEINEALSLVQADLRTAKFKKGE